jgi:hypothetical protein
MFMGYVVTFAIGTWFGFAVCALMAAAKDN